MKLALTSLQGIVNRHDPRIYLIRAGTNDEAWLADLIKHGDVNRGTRLETPEQLLEIYRDEIHGAVIWDASLESTINIATMIAGVSDCVVSTEELADRWGIDTEHDLRERWSNNADAYQWALDNLWDQLDHEALCSLAPRAADFELRDYLISHRLYTFWVTGPSEADLPGSDTEAEKRVIEEVFRQTHENIPVIGFWYAWVDGRETGISEYGGVKWAGEYGKFTVVCDWASNLTVHSGVKIAPTVFRQTPPKMDVEVERKIYLCFTVIESGDSPMYWLHRQRQVWEGLERGTMPVAWSINPLTIDLMPGVIRWYYNKATPIDRFFCSISGVGYMYPLEGYGSKTEDPEATLEGFLDLTRKAMNRMDLSIVGVYSHPWSEYHFKQDDSILEKYAERIPGLTGIFSDMGRNANIDIENANYDLPSGVPVFHCLSRWPRGEEAVTREERIDWLVKEIRNQSGTEAPGFMHVMAYSWIYDPGMLKEVLAALGEDYVPVTPEELIALWDRR